MILSRKKEQMFAVFRYCQKSISGVWQGGVGHVGRAGHVDIDLRHSPTTLILGALGGEIEFECYIRGGCQF